MHIIRNIGPSFHIVWWLPGCQKILSQEQPFLAKKNFSQTFAKSKINLTGPYLALLLGISGNRQENPPAPVGIRRA